MTSLRAHQSGYQCGFVVRWRDVVGRADGRFAQHASCAACIMHGHGVQERGKDIFRSKGTLCIHGQKRLFNFQGVHETFQFAACKLLTEADMNNPHSEIVFIGRDLDKEAIKQVLVHRHMHTWRLQNGCTGRQRPALCMSAPRPLIRRSFAFAGCACSGRQPSDGMSCGICFTSPRAGRRRGWYARNVAFATPSQLGCHSPHRVFLTCLAGVCRSELPHVIVCCSAVFCYMVE